MAAPDTTLLKQRHLIRLSGAVGGLLLALIAVRDITEESKEPMPQFPTGLYTGMVDTDFAVSACPQMLAANYTKLIDSMVSLGTFCAAVPPGQPSLYGQMRQIVR